MANFYEARVTYLLPKIYATLDLFYSLILAAL